MTITEGSCTPPKGRFAICQSRFNELITDALLKGALDMLCRLKIAEEAVEVFRVPGAFELPGLVKRLEQTQKYVGIIALGCVIRGQTPHFEYIASAVAAQLAQLAASASCSISFGVLTCDDVAQAMDRAGLKCGNKGAEAAASCVEMANLFARISKLEDS
ncbi:MAG: 6,7-dimethyl-8-ribityllumazine synthase [Proteobacteria bacterium]|nr:6,7-dimethyl-8-ribityllumazine synthase [Cystobacterineae bacterium]MCL2314546.1 6,7-dimethyl-8-ribityllumazine synthase [Pseudomonadota bacterium]